MSQEIPDVGEDADFERVQDKEAQMKILKLFGKIEYYDDHVNSGFK
uniref:Uncharacterized protein n=1 Tax=uncultured Thiotrichaceae bacterium TaxID=298394 RepID=A0A6S6TGU2_9GAMM|nr:MAG: Unknown protein [uncultured Thiotrichaceae bacterium]